MKSISQSQINLFRSCPHAYELSYYYGYVPIMYDPTVMEVGKRVHNVIDKYYKNHYDKSNNEQDILGCVYNLLRNEWDVKLPVEYLVKAHKCICNFAKFELNNNHNPLATKPITEAKIYADDVMGIIDYIDLQNEQFIDWKTNNKAILNYEYKMQAVMYKKLIKSKFDINIKKFRFVFLYPAEFKEVNLNNNNLQQIEQDLIMYKEKIKQAWQTLFFPKEPRTQSVCNYCNYRYYCRKER